MLPVVSRKICRTTPRASIQQVTPLLQHRSKGTPFSTARKAATAYVAQRESLGVPLLKDEAERAKWVKPAEPAQAAAPAAPMVEAAPAGAGGRPGKRRP